MKLSEAMAKLEGNQQFKFDSMYMGYRHVLCRRGGFIYIDAYNEGGQLIPSNIGRGQFNGNLTINMEWEQIQEPVDFMTAANSGKRIKCEGWDFYYFLHKAMYILQNRDNELDLINGINGKWY